MVEKDDHEITSKTAAQSIPEFLYKYCELNEDTRKWIQRIFTHNELYFSSSPQFNDPFDCRVQSSFDATDDDWEDYLDGKLQDRHPDWSYDDRQMIMRQLVKEGWLNDPLAQQKIVNDLQDAVDALGVYCLSEFHDNILMWTHYADNHRGLCLQFYIKPEMHPFGKSLFEVEYSSSYPQIRLSGNREDQARKVILTKADIRKHEKEWRILDPDNGPGIRVFPAEMLTGVIFGCDISYEDRQLIREWAKGREIPLKFYQAKKKEKQFGLEIINVIG